MTGPIDTNADLEQVGHPADSRRDPEVVRVQLQQWLTAKLGASAEPTVDAVTVPTASGMSNDTILFDAEWSTLFDAEWSTLFDAEWSTLFDAEWSTDETRSTHRLVARIAPANTTLPVFPSYNLGRQFQVIRAVGSHSAVPVPAAYWCEPSSAALGAEFFVMERVDGDVPPDAMPYNFDSWLSQANSTDRARLQDTSVRVLAQLHAIPEPQQCFSFLLDEHTDGMKLTADQALRDHVAAQRRYYAWVIGDGPRSSLIERGFDWIESHWPTPAGPAVLCWGDARIGNIIYSNFEPAAVLDWEMASFGPREMDLGWMIYLHRFFEDIAALAGLPGLPDFLRRDDVVKRYRELSSHRPTQLDFYTCYAALRHAIIMFRIQSRAVAFGLAQAPADPNDLIMHRKAVEAMLAGTYWSGVDAGFGE
ncbi:phosphotransferase family protein [Antrihabitans cavernicola]|uniref:Phosphotransferase family protein n=1 Tax=Antrihabitans cavernicola TaxID=2495913 RepID=A0A5A7SDH1_9NOCA|nr:phosphotransferase family protein [Spelaeibacter cavernicola]KAA0024200.1 phosphotransferase family protein [Spelaeibacter cavernicola]